MLEPKDVTILVVDDEAPLRKAIIFDFKRRGFNVLEAASGNEAFEVVKNNKIHVVVSDVRMPDGNGVELLDNIKSMNPEIPVVMFITGFADLTLEDAYSKGAEAVFSKPFNRKELMETVMKAIRSKEELWGPGGRQHERFETQFDIQLKFPDLGIAIQGKVLNIGRGGMFVALDDQFPAHLAKAAFRIQFSEGRPQVVEGSGIVRWVRTRDTENGLKGCGIEFESLSDESRGQVIELMRSLRPKAFIPKT